MEVYIAFIGFLILLISLSSTQADPVEEKHFVSLTSAVRPEERNRVICGKQCAISGTCTGFVVGDPCQLIMDSDPRSVCSTLPNELCYGRKDWSIMTTERSAEVTTEVTPEVTPEATTEITTEVSLAEGCTKPTSKFLVTM